MKERRSFTYILDSESCDERLTKTFSCDICKEQKHCAGKKDGCALFADVYTSIGRIAGSCENHNLNLIISVPAHQFGDKAQQMRNIINSYKQKIK